MTVRGSPHGLKSAVWALRLSFANYSLWFTTKTAAERISGFPLPREIPSELTRPQLKTVTC